MRSIAILACLASLAAAAPSLAQDAMASHGQMASGSMKMSAGQMRKAKACSAMSHDAMMKNAGCAKMMKAHPDMMQHDSMMSSGH